ncbi:basic helix-loop-helix (bHLH) DNA-binding superfamily protein [Actinidia rufa]|uniref:Basic helix-loop-helix (BHLH) DNA-binding superfamily protein n=1 Tax=Actinidia rufa TaxID=165716 RepID=A0A7J0FI44_9ERIC|nr:basic helix-loop-helix (bHLH) DNA-binding superfamily protein [Actinidia rufa]
MNRGHVLPVQQMVAGISPSWWSNNMSNMRPPIMSQQNTSSTFLPPPSSNLFPHYTQPPPPLSSSWHDNQELPESWRQLLLGGLVGEEEKSGLSHVQAKKLENWEEQGFHHQAPNNGPCGELNQDHNYVYGHGSVDHHYQAPAKPTNWSQMMPASSPTSCVTSLSSSMLDFSNNKADGRHPPPDRSSECNSTATGGALKKAKVQPSSIPSTFKVRKEKLGDRITALHQLVSPFGKTDTASVLLEAIGYIRFLQSQVEALSLPYLGSGSGNMRRQQSVQGERNCLFPEDPGQDSHGELNKDLRSRGLCLVPISCTMQVGSDNGADYWAPALSGGFQSKFC